MMDDGNILCTNEVGWFLSYDIIINICIISFSFRITAIFSLSLSLSLILSLSPLFLSGLDVSSATAESMPMGAVCPFGVARRMPYA